MIFGDNIEELIYVLFHQESGPGLCRKFHLNKVVSDLDDSTDQLVIVPYNTTNGLYNGKHVKEALIASYKHDGEERCAVWRYLLFTRPPGIRCVRYARFPYPAAALDRFGLISVNQIEEFGV